MKKNSKKRYLLLLSVGFALAACSVERNYEGSYGSFTNATSPDEEFYSSTLGELDLRAGALEGTIGPMYDMQEDAAQLIGWQEPEWTSVELSVKNDQGAAMTWLDLDGGLFHLALKPGAQFTFLNSRMNPETNLYVSGVGCAGSTIGSWSYDQPIDEVTVEVQETEDPQVNRLLFNTRIGENDAEGFIDFAAQN